MCVACDNTSDTSSILEGFDADDKPILRAATSPVTVRHLLTHTSGYVYVLWNADAGRNVALGNVASISAGGDAFVDAPLSFDPGTQWEYGIGTDIYAAEDAGHIFQCT